QLPWRESDQKVFVADIEKATRILGWLPKVSKESGVELMINWLL
ncbi:CDP-paratose 2-epimerase, partial [Bacteroides hominis (ex Afrizal et al. 2022)]